MAQIKKGTADTQSAKPKDKKLVTVKEAGRNMKHGLYCDPSKVKVDGRSFFGKLKKTIKNHFLESFKGTPSALAQALADGAAANLILAKNFQASFLKGEKLPSSILRDYVGLWNSISRDLQALSQMAKESGAKDSSPDLQEYVEALKKAGKATPTVVKVGVKEEAAVTPEESVRKGPLF
jgi:hypothetical protein